MWFAFRRVEGPWDDSRADLNASIIAATIINWSGKTMKEGAKAVDPTDLMPFLEREPPAIDVSSQIRSAFTRGS